MKETLSVIIVEDNVDLRESTLEFLTLSGLQVTGAASGLEFYQALAKNSYDVTVLDIGLPDQNGYVLSEYARNNTRMGIIILTARDNIDDRVQGYSCGADLYLVKPVDTRELLAAIISLIGRQRSKQQESHLPAKAGTWLLLKELWTLLSPGSVMIKLTSKEFRLLEALIKNADNPVSRDQLITLLGYSDDEYANRAMDSLVRRLRRKIEGFTHLPSPIKTVHSAGYCFTAPAIIS
ncbi:MAG: DNA-binding response regulator [Deltaproteobacteria bacterium HGW-Deltaproteobacteria-23]|nr:MAG: DNA-binding response regulator [Deltaproteobacteria bacterium HGW-Deltaproteobacteria-23]